MIIALISIGIIAVFLLLGLLDRPLKALGLNVLWTVIILAVLVGSAFIPYINIMGVRFGVAGFVLPVIAMGILDYRTGFNRELLFSKISATIIAAMVFVVSYFTFGLNYTQISLITLGLSLVIAVVAFLLTKTYSSAISSVISGIIVGDVVSQILAYFTMGSIVSIGSTTIFGLIMLSILACGVGIQIFSSIREKFVSHSVRKRSMSSEEAQENDFDEKYFDEYFINHDEER